MSRLNAYEWHQIYETVKKARRASHDELYVCTCPVDGKDEDCFWFLPEAEKTQRFEAAVIERMESP